MPCYRCHPKHVLSICVAFVVIAICLLLHQFSSVALLGGAGTNYKLSAPGDRVFVVKGDGHVAEVKGDPIEWIARGSSGRVPVVVVEEHHEVLSHWFSAADNGVISKTGNLLIHIDGHSDGAPPTFFPGYPESFYPRTPEELRVMTQRNDAFILEAAMAGLITHTVWVWPEWDQSNHEEPHQVMEMLLGVADILYTNMDNTRIKTGCLCEADTHHKPLNCSFLNMTADDQPEQNIDPKLCQIKTSLIFEDIREDIALEMARNGSLFTRIKDENKGKLLLDIDEDFYGCESVIQPILDDKFTMEQVRLINFYVNKLFRPLTTAMEAAIDKFMSDLIKTLIQFKDCGEDTTICQQALKEKMSTFSKGVNHVSVFKAGFRFGKGPTRKRYLTMLLNKLKELSSSQLTKLKELGFCFRTTPKAYDFDPLDDEHVRLCHGANTPGSSVVIYHTPTKEETQKRTRLVVDFLESTKKFTEPSLVTVCRSMRDGYTPRTFFKQIERDVLSSVSSLYKTDRIHYDIDLLGGKFGWPDRHSD